MARGMGAAWVALAALSGASCGAEKVVPRRPATASSAYAVVQAGGRTKAYLPQPAPATGNAFIAVVSLDVPGSGVAGAPARIGTIDLGGTVPATFVAGDERGIVAAAGRTPTLWFIDPATDLVTATVTLDGRFGSFRYPGALLPQYVTGALVDADRGVVYLAVWNGIAEMDLKTHQVLRQFIAAPTESPGYDPSRGLLFAPFYGCAGAVACLNPDQTPLCLPGTGTPPPCDAVLAEDGTVVTDGLNVISVLDGTVYTYRDAGTGPAFAQDSSPDGAAVDPIAQVAVIPLEDALVQVFLDMSRASFDSAHRTFTAPRTDHPDLFLEAVAVDPATHLAFMAGAFDTRVAVLDVRDGVAGATIHQGTMPDLPGGTAWQSAGDPHPTGLALIGERPMGLLADLSFRWLARIDLDRMASLPRAGEEWTGPELAPAVTYLDATAPVPP